MHRRGKKGTKGKKKKKKKKRKFQWQQMYARKYGLQVVGRAEGSGLVTAACCRFCMSFGREKRSEPDAVDTGRPRKKARVATKSVKQWTLPFRTDNIKHHMILQHKERWGQYEVLLQHHALSRTPGMDGVRDGEINEFFSQTHVLSYFHREETNSAVVSVSKAVVDEILLGLVRDGDDSCGASGFTGALQDDEHDPEKYIIRVRNTTQFMFVKSLLGSGLSFKQCSAVVSTSREHLGAVAKLGYVNEGQASFLAKVTCAKSLDIISAALRKVWTFAVALDAATDRFGKSLLDVRVCVPFQGDVHNIHVLAIPLCEEHTGQYMFEVLSRLLSALQPSWQDKIVGVTTDGARAMTGVRRGVATRLERVAASGFMRVWCGAHQLDLSLKKALNVLHKDGDGDFINLLTKLIGFLRRKQKLVAEMKCKSPYYTSVRWLSLGQVTYMHVMCFAELFDCLLTLTRICWGVRFCQVTKWYMKHKPRIEAFLVDNNVDWRPGGAWWVDLVVVHTLCEHYNCASVAMQDDHLMLSDQILVLRELSASLIATVGAVRNADVNVDPKDAMVCTEEMSTLGAFSVDHSVVMKHVQAMSLSARSGLSALPEAEALAVCKKCAALFLTAAHAVWLTVPLRDFRNKPSVVKAPPPTRPLDFVSLSSVQFSELVAQHSSRLSVSLPVDVVDHGLIVEHRELVRALRREPVLKANLEKCGKKELRKSWEPLGARVPHLHQFATGLACVLPGTCSVERDFSVINYQCHSHRSALTTFALEGILHAKQRTVVAKLMCWPD